MQFFRVEFDLDSQVIHSLCLENNLIFKITQMQPHFIRTLIDFVRFSQVISVRITCFKYTWNIRWKAIRCVGLPKMSLSGANKYNRKRANKMLEHIRLTHLEECREKKKNTHKTKRIYFSPDIFCVDLGWTTATFNRVDQNLHIDLGQCIRRQTTVVPI